MVATSPPPRSAPRRPRRPLRRLARALAAVFALLVAVILALFAMLATETGLAWFAGELVARSGGAITIEGASGTLLDTVRAQRIAWRGTDTTVVATDVALTWRPWALFSRNILVHALGARTLDVELRPSNTAMPPPQSLELPLHVAIEHVGVGTLTWRVGANGGSIEGLEFGYAGDATEHRVSDLRLVTMAGTITGDATLGARPPFPLAARIQVAGDATLRDARAELVASGSLSALAVDATITAGEGRATAHAALAPLAIVPLVSIAVDAHDIDLAAWNRALPSTRIAGTIDAKPANGGLAGSLDFRNSLIGALDTDRTPIRAFAAQFAWTSDAIAFDAINAEVGGGRATGRGRIALGGAATGGNWHLDVRDVDLRQLFPRLVATRVAGTIDANLDPAGRTVTGALADRSVAGGISVEFALAFDDRAVDIQRLRARAGGGEARITGRVELEGRRAFSLNAAATKLDPARFGAYPAGAIDADVRATGALAPTWRLDGSVALGQGSKLAGLALGGNARGSIERGRVRDAAIDLKAGRATLVANGSLGAAGDRMTFAFDAPKLAELVPLLPKVPRTLAGEVHLEGDATGAPPDGGLDVTAHGAGLKLGGGVALATLDAHGTIAPSSTGKLDLASRTLSLEVAATDVRTPSGDVVGGHIQVAGTLAAHTITLALDGGDVGLAAKAHGGLQGDPANDALTALAWTGSVDAFSGRGPWAMKLDSPASLALAYHKVRLGAARFTVADGTVEVSEFAWDEGRITSSGRFTAVPLATLARLAGRPLPVHSTLTFGGEWSLAATPKLNGTAVVRREQGDLWLVREQDAGTTTNAAAGITELEATARARDDAIDATLRYRAARGGSIDAKVALGVDAEAPPGRISPRAPLALTLVAELSSLAVLQPWAGTTAVIDGKLHADLAAHGTLADAPVSGTVTGTDLTIDAPQYGLHFRQGRLSARLANRRITLDDLAFSAGTGEFKATGTLAAPTDEFGASAAHVAWHAEKFHVFNRPDFNLVVTGNGELALAKGKVTLTGSLRADEGHFVYQFDPYATLGDDVVVKGWDRTSPDRSRANADVPLAVDVNLDLGDRLTFTGRGLEAGLRGEVRVQNGPGGFTGRGQLYTVNGTYFAYGQRLTIDPGRLIFDGPLDNPALDIIALRRNLQVEAGVRVTGTVRVPIITLTSNPPVPDNEKLAWLVLGQSLSSTSSADFAALQAASAALLGPNARPVTTSIAQSFGLDDISFKSATGTPTRGTTAATPGASGQVVTLGKRLNERLTVAWEQGLTVATNALRVEYALTNTLSVRAEAGTVSGVGLYYRRNFE